MKHKDFTEEQVERLKSNGKVGVVCRCTFSLTPDAYLYLYELWKSMADKEVLEDKLAEWGFTEDLLENGYVETLIWSLRRGIGNKNSREHLVKCATDVALVVSGLCLSKYGNVEWLPGTKKEILDGFPESSIEESLYNMGLSPKLLGPKRVGSLRNYCRKSIADAVMYSCSKKDSKLAEMHPARGGKSSDLRQYWEHPYVEIVEGKKSLVMRDTFFNEVSMLASEPIDEVLGVYGIDASLFSSVSLGVIRAKMLEWKRTEDVQPITSEQIMHIQMRRLVMLEKHVEENFKQIRGAVKSMGPGKKKIICLQLSKYPTSLNYPYGYSLREILGKVGISKTTYYRALYSKEYGMAEELRRERDARDLEVVMRVVTYKGFEKGLRQIYMMMPDITGEQFAISKIRRLLRNAGIKTKIRGENPARQRVREFHDRNTKPNILKREFRLHRPNEIRLTDVTYLNYGRIDNGDRRRAYGSSCIDPVTGKLLAFNVSENNDVELAMETLARLSEHPTMIGALFHSDQGILYLTDEFQEKVAELGMVQSMSKRGNCWDNAPQESFFGHFKDECHYEDCETFEQLQAMIDEYAYYYNYERHQWSRNKMTPIEYEKYMQAMTDEEFAAYMKDEQAKYANMKKRAEEKAIERAKTLGV